MSEMPPNNAERRQPVRVSKEQHEEILRMMRAKQQATARQRAPQMPQQQPREASLSAPQNVAPHHKYAAPTPAASFSERTSPRKSERTTTLEAPVRKRRLSRKTTVAIIAGSLLVSGGTVAAVNHDSVQSAALSAFGNKNTDDVITKGSPVTEASFTAKHCEDPDNALMVATVNAELPLIPLLPTDKDPKTSVKSKPYMTKENMENMSSDRSEIFSPFVNDAGYLQVEAVNLPLAMTVCTPDKSTAFSQNNGKYTIDFSQMEVKFQDPYALMKEELPVVRQNDSPTDLDTEKTEPYYLSVPAEWHNLFLNAKTGDKAHDEAVKKLIESYVTPEQLQLFLADIETQVVDKANTSVNGENNITFPGSEKSLQDSVATSIVERITGKSGQKPNVIGSLAISAAVPLNASKRPITEADPKTGASPFVYLDPTAEVNITDMTIKTGTIKPKKETSVNAASNK